ncbi:hypothetical protein [Cytobacillus sp. SAFR-174]|uniref:hypothetical protein n=1 Tax=Cytobacillus sp. SAFR-174 TaxID=3436868 RepID=UPI003F823531
MSWKNVKVTGINSIEKLVSEFEVSAFSLLGDVFEEGEVIPYAGFKVRIYETQDDQNGYLSYMNLKIKDTVGVYEGAIGYGKNEQAALESILNNFITKIEESKLKKTLPSLKTIFL